MGSADTRTLSQRALRCQPRKGHERKGADRVRDHTGEQECVETAVIGWTRPSHTLFLVYELIGEHHERDGQDNDSAGAWPGIHAAEEEIGGEESARKQNQGRDHDADRFCKPCRLTPPSFSLIGGRVSSHVLTASLTVSGAPNRSCSTRHILHTRGRTLRNLNLPLTRQL